MAGGRRLTAARREGTLPELSERLRTALEGRYAIERELGSGGMATVWLARDLRYDRAVAVKVLRPDLSAALGADRFLREIRITAQLNHPHVLPLLDSGEADGLLYYVMPYVAGGSLRERLVPGRPLPLDAALHVVSHVAAALEHAHRHGVVHRDVKPENVLFSDGEPIVADFGIARAVTSAGGGRLTRTGFPLGTPGYMSPEQAAGGGRLDARTDVFGLACVAYEMVVGGTPEMWPTEEAVRLGRFLDASDRHRAWLDTLPGRAEQVLVRALAVRPDDRYATPDAFAAALSAAAAGAPKLTEAQVHAVLQRAAELQAIQPTQDGALTVGAVEQVAAQVGIPPEHVRQAVREIVGPIPIAHQPIGAAAAPGAPPALPPRTNVVVRGQRLTVARTVAREISVSEHAGVLAALRTALGAEGDVVRDGRALTWRSSAAGTPDRSLVVTLAPEDGVTRIRIEEQLSLSAWGRYVVAQAGAGIGGAIGLFTTFWMLGWARQPLFSILPTALLAALGGIAGARVFLAASADRRAPVLAALADRLATQVAAPQLTAGPASENASGRG
jgi:hypothetical protein